MIALRNRRAHFQRACRRQGMIAIHEVVLILALLIALSWLIPQMLAIHLHISTAAFTSKPPSVSRICLDPEGHQLSLFRAKEGIFSINLATGDSERSLLSLPTEFTCVNFSGDGRMALLCELDGAVVLYDGDEDVDVAHVSLEGDVEVRLLVADNGCVALCVTTDGQIVGWQRDGSEFVQFKYHLPSEPAIQFACADSTLRRMCLIRNDGSVSFHRTIDGETEGPHFRIGSDNLAATWNNDLERIVVLTDTCRVIVFDAVTGLPIRNISLEMHRQRCNAGVVRLSPDGKRIAAATDVSAEIYIWNLDSGGMPQKLSGHSLMARAIQFSPDSNRLYSGSYDGTVREWSLDMLTQLRALD